jgi:superfamily II DNA/RNA helicase
MDLSRLTQDIRFSCGLGGTPLPLLINYTLPSDSLMRSYVSRVGASGRCYPRIVAVSLIVGGEDVQLLRELERSWHIDELAELAQLPEQLAR